MRRARRTASPSDDGARRGARVALRVPGCAVPGRTRSAATTMGAHDHDADHRSQQGPRPRGRPPPDRRRATTSGSPRATPERGQAAADALGARFVAARRHRRRERRRRRRDGRRRRRPRRARQQRRHRRRPRRRCRDHRRRRRRRSSTTNVLGIVRVTQAFLPLLERSPNPVDRQRVQRHGLARRHDRPRRGSSRRSSASPTRPRSRRVNMLTTQYAKALPGHPHQRRRPRLHRDRPQRPPRPPDRRGGHRRDRADGADRRVRPDRHVRRSPRRRAVVISAGR